MITILLENHFNPVRAAKPSDCSLGGTSISKHGKLLTLGASSRTQSLTCDTHSVPTSQLASPIAVFLFEFDTNPSTSKTQESSPKPEDFRFYFWLLTFYNP